MGKSTVEARKEARTVRPPPAQPQHKAEAELARYNEEPSLYKKKHSLVQMKSHDSDDFYEHVEFGYKWLRRFHKEDQAAVLGARAPESLRSV